jgi:hypothetical protein
MQIAVKSGRRGSCQGLTIAETLVACGVVGLLVMANMSAVYHMRILSAKDAERGIVSGFMQHYAELLKALPFDQVRTNLPISGQYSGANGSPRLVIPSSAGPVDLSDVNYQVFHPTLLWVTNRHPELSVSITTSNLADIPHDKHIVIQVQWDPPMLGPRQTQRLDLFRVKDL